MCRYMNHGLKVLILGRGLHPPWVEGGRVILRNLALALLRHGTEIKIVTSADKYYRFGLREDLGPLQGNVTIVKATALADGVLGATTLFKLHRKFDAYILGSLTFLPSAFLSNFFQLQSALYVSLVHDGFTQTLKASALGLAAKTSAKIACSSQWVANNFRRAFKSSHVSKVINPIISSDEPQFGEKNDAKTVLDLSEDDFVILYMGYLEYPRLPANIVLPTLKKLRRELRRPVKLLVCTSKCAHDQTYLRSFLRLLKAPDLKGEVKLIVRNLTENRKKLVYQASDVVIFPFLKLAAVDPPLTLLEAMANEKLVLATPVQGIPYIIKDGLNGFILRSTDEPTLFKAFKWLVTHSDDLKDVRRRARETIVNEFSEQRVVQDFLSFLREN